MKETTTQEYNLADTCVREVIVVPKGPLSKRMMEAYGELLKMGKIEEVKSVKEYSEAKHEPTSKATAE